MSDEEDTPDKETKPGWLKRQMDAAEREVAEWPTRKKTGTIEGEEDVVVEALERYAKVHRKDICSPLKRKINEALPIARQRARLWPLYEQTIKLLKHASERMLDGTWQRETESILKAINEAKRQEEKYRD